MKTQECRAGMLIPADNLFMIICGHLNMSANARWPVSCGCFPRCDIKLETYLLESERKTLCGIS